jgi:hypothetical protein
MSQGHHEAAWLLYELTGRRIKRSGKGLPGWCVRVERHPTAPLTLVAGQWWPKAVTDAAEVGSAPLLLYRADRQPWRAVWPAMLHKPAAPTCQPLRTDFADTLTAEPFTWWRMCKAITEQTSPQPV